jgi:hypothetical protein
MDPKQRFLQKVGPPNEHGCWPWIAYRNEWGYGNIEYEGKTCLAHRVSYILHYGPIPEGLYILHSCNNRCCVNPDHLRAGTQKDNAIDMVIAGNVSGQILSAQNVHDIRRLLNQGVLNQNAIAYMFGVKQKAISNIKTGISWAHLPEEDSGTAAQSVSGGQCTAATPEDE